MTRLSMAKLWTDWLDEVMLRDWDRVVETVGDRMRPMDYYPERWLVERFPSEEQLFANRCGSGVIGVKSLTGHHGKDVPL